MDLRLSTPELPHTGRVQSRLRQIASEYLALTMKISVRHGDTATIPQGITMGSRQVAVGGEGVKNASLKIVESAKSIAGIEANPEI